MSCPLEATVAKVRLIDAEPRMVPWLGERVVQPDEVVEVPEAQFESYVCQPGVWESVEEPAAAPAKKASNKAAASRKGDEV